MPIRPTVCLQCQVLQGSGAAASFADLKTQSSLCRSDRTFYGTAFDRKTRHDRPLHGAVTRANGGDMFAPGPKPLFQPGRRCRGRAVVQGYLSRQAVPAHRALRLDEIAAPRWPAGQLAVDLVLPGFAGILRAESSNISDDLGFAPAPVAPPARSPALGAVRHSFSPLIPAVRTTSRRRELCVFMTTDDIDMMEAEAATCAVLPSPPRSSRWFQGHQQAGARLDVPSWHSRLPMRSTPLSAQWIEVSNVLWPRLVSAVIVGQRADQGSRSMMPPAPGRRRSCTTPAALPELGPPSLRPSVTCDLAWRHPVSPCCRSFHRVVPL